MLAKLHVGLIAIGRLTSATPFEGAFNSRPTIDEPTEILLSYQMLDMHLIAVWAYDRTTGLIYGKLNAKE
jgi:hypothetical protein